MADDAITFNFLGTSPLNLDSKGRVAMPARHREVLETGSEGKIVINPDIRDECLVIFPVPVWVQFQEKVMTLPFREDIQDLQRHLIGGAQEIEFDSAGRMTIPPHLREQAELGKQVLLIGQGKKLELWDKARWEAKRERWKQELKTKPLPPELHTLNF